MPRRHLPVHPDLEQLRHQAKDLLRAIRAGDASARAELAEFHPEKVDPAACKLADAQLVLARSYEAPSWARLVLACRLVDAIWDDDVDEVRALVTNHPKLLHEPALVRPKSNWGAPMSYAANIGRDGIIQMLHGLGARDHSHALGRALLQGQVDTARWLHSVVGSPSIPANEFGGPAYTLNVAGTKLLFEMGAQLERAHGMVRAPVNVVIQSDSRRPAAKHEILAIYEEHGVVYPDTPVMALHRGRIDLLERHLSRDPQLLTRTFAYEEVFPASLGCGAESLPRTSVDGVTLLHLAIEFAEVEIAHWLFANGMRADQPAAVDRDGFGGFTPLFTAVVCYANRWGNFRGATPDATFGEILLQHGANPGARASIRERVDVEAPVVSWREHRNITAREWGARYHYQPVVNSAVMRMLEARESPA